MISTTPEQLVAAQKAGVDKTFDILNKTVGAFEKLAGLNLQTAKSNLAEKQESLAKAFGAAAPQAFFAEQSGRAQTAIEKAQAYWREVHAIVSDTRAEFQALAEAQLKEYRSNAQGYFENLAKSAPAGSEPAVTAWKTFITTLGDTANTAYETATKAIKQAEETAASEIAAAAPSPVKRTRQLAAPVEASEK